jgi:hypothetical protein
MLPEPYATLLPIVLFMVGQTFVLSSTWILGITGTFLGDYFGILMDHRVEGFPFNVLENPMYVGSTMCFLATALWWLGSFLAFSQISSLDRKERPAGLVITGFVHIAYTIALRYEGYVCSCFSPPEITEDPQDHSQQWFMLTGRNPMERLERTYDDYHFVISCFCPLYDSWIQHCILDLHPYIHELKRSCAAITLFEWWDGEQKSLLTSITYVWQQTTLQDQIVS